MNIQRTFKPLTAEPRDKPAAIRIETRIRERVADNKITEGRRHFYGQNCQWTAATLPRPGPSGPSPDSRRPATRVTNVRSTIF